MNEKGEQQFRKEGWASLCQYSLILFGVAMMTGFFITRCSDAAKGPRWATVVMYVTYGFLWLIALACFMSIGFRLSEKRNDH